MGTPLPKPPDGTVLLSTDLLAYPKPLHNGSVACLRTAAGNRNHSSGAQRSNCGGWYGLG